MSKLKDGIFDTGMGTIAYSHIGHGTPLLLIHGFPEFRGIWETVANHLADRFSLVMPDLPGFGESSAPEQRMNMRADGLGGQLDMLMGDLGYRRYSVVTHDIGAVVGWWLAACRPRAVDRLTLVGAVAPLDYLSAIHSLDAEGRRTHVSKLLAGDPIFLSTDTLLGWLNEPILKSELVQAFKRGSISAMQALYQQNLVIEAVPFWTTIPQPEKLCRILGKDDPFVPPTMFSTGYGHTICLDGVGHFLPTVCPKILARFIANFNITNDPWKQAQ